MSKNYFDDIVYNKELHNLYKYLLLEKKLLEEDKHKYSLEEQKSMDSYMYRL